LSDSCGITKLEGGSRISAAYGAGIQPPAMIA
jgi:hypothetical protein